MWRKNSHKIASSKMLYQRTERGPLALYIPKWFFVLCSVVVVGLGLVYFFVIGPYFYVNSIMIEGKINQSARDLVESNKGKNIFSVDSYSLASNIKKLYPEAYNVRVFKGLPSTLKVSLSERTAEIVWNSRGKYFLVDRLGLVFKTASGLESVGENMVVVTDLTDFEIKDGQRIVSVKFIEFVKDLDQNFEKMTEVKLKQITVGETSFHPVVVTELGWRVILDSNRSCIEQITDLELILKKHKSDIHEYVDLRIPGAGYYK